MTKIKRKLMPVILSLILIFTIFQYAFIPYFHADTFTWINNFEIVNMDKERKIIKIGLDYKGKAEIGKITEKIEDLIFSLNGKVIELSDTSKSKIKNLDENGGRLELELENIDFNSLKESKNEIKLRPIIRIEEYMDISGLYNYYTAFSTYDAIEDFSKIYDSMQDDKKANLIKIFELEENAYKYQVMEKFQSYLMSELEKNPDEKLFEKISEILNSDRTKAIYKRLYIDSVMDELNESLNKRKRKILEDLITKVEEYQKKKDDIIDPKNVKKDEKIDLSNEEKSPDYLKVEDIPGIGNDVIILNDDENLNNEEKNTENPKYLKIQDIPEMGNDLVVLEESKENIEDPKEIDESENIQEDLKFSEPSIIIGHASAVNHKLKAPEEINRMIKVYCIKTNFDETAVLSFDLNKIKVRYIEIDKEGKEVKELHEPIIEIGLHLEEFTTDKKEFSGYDFVKSELNEVEQEAPVKLRFENGKENEVVYKYIKKESGGNGGGGSSSTTEQGKVRVKYIEVDDEYKPTGVVLQDTDVLTGDVGSIYITYRKIFEDYNFVRMSPNSAEPEGYFQTEEQEVIYEYIKIKEYIPNDNTPKNEDKSDKEKENTPKNEDNPKEESDGENEDYIIIEEDEIPNTTPNSRNDETEEKEIPEEKAVKRLPRTGEEKNYILFIGIGSLVAALVIKKRNKNK